METEISIIEEKIRQCAQGIHRTQICLDVLNHDTSVILLVNGIG